MTFKDYHLHNLAHFSWLVPLPQKFNRFYPSKPVLFFLSCSLSTPRPPMPDSNDAAPQPAALPPAPGSPRHLSSLAALSPPAALSSNTGSRHTLRADLVIGGNWGENELISPWIPSNPPRDPFSLNQPLEEPQNRSGLEELKSTLYSILNKEEILAPLIPFCFWTLK